MRSGKRRQAALAEDERRKTARLLCDADARPSRSRSVDDGQMDELWQSLEREQRRLRQFDSYLKAAVCVDAPPPSPCVPPGRTGGAGGGLADGIAPLPLRMDGAGGGLVDGIAPLPSRMDGTGGGLVDGIAMLTSKLHAQKTADRLFETRLRFILGEHVQ